MEIEKIYFKSCCGGEGTILKLSSPISKDLLNALKQQSYVESEVFTRSGILYVDNKQLTVTGAFGSNKLQLKCKSKDCNQIINQLEELLKAM